MRLARFETEGNVLSGVLVEDRLVALARINEALGTDLPLDLDDVVQRERLSELRGLSDRLPRDGHRLEEVRLRAPLLRPPKIWCIGLNYVEHASDLSETSPEEPASFMRPAFSIVGPGDTIRLPAVSERVTGEAELAVVLGARCRDVTASEAERAIAAVVPAVDTTAEDILRRNPRFLTRAKSFDTFLSLGPFLVTPDEIGPIREIRTTTRLNRKAERTNVVSNMRHDPFDLVAFHSRGMTWLPGDVLLTGTPGAVVLSDGDVVGSEVSGVGRLENPVAKDR